MKKLSISMAAIVLALASEALAHEEMDLPPGPIKDRHELMEGIGANAKKIGEALKAKKVDPIAPAAEKIAASAKKIPAVFPPGSTHEKSRAKPEIWQSFDKFEAISDALSTHAQELAKTAHDGGDTAAAAKVMFGDCKSCHDQFRVPEKE